MSTERRKLERKHLVIYSRVFDRKTGRIIGYLGDMTSGGAMIIGEQRIEPGTELDLRFDLPDMPELDRDHLDVRARTVWCQPDVDPSFVNVGFNFLDLAEEHLKIVEILIDLYEFRHQIQEYPPTFTELEDRSPPSTP
jgi:hypothetical protein